MSQLSSESNVLVWTSILVSHFSAEREHFTTLVPNHRSRESIQSPRRRSLIHMVLVECDCQL